MSASPPGATGGALRWAVASFDALSPHLLYAILRLRSQIFVVEQQCIFLEMDGRDATAWHLTAEREDGLVAYARLFAPGGAGEPAVIGRVVVSFAERGTGLGRTLMERAIAECGARWAGAPIRLEAQAHLERFYASLGFAPVGDVYLEDDIPHLSMVRGTP